MDVFRLDRNKCQFVFSLVIISTCVFNLIWTRSVIYVLDDWSNAMSMSLGILQTKVVAVLSFASRGIALYHMKFDKYQSYKTTLESFDIYSPMTAAALNRCKMFSLAIYCLSLTIIAPINVIKLLNLYIYHPDGFMVVVYFLFYYVQNLSMCFVENHFIVQCFTVFAQFRAINDELENIKSDHTDRKKYPFLADTSNSSPDTLSSIIYDKDFYCPNDRDHPLANTVELLKIRHWLSRKAVAELNRLYGYHLAFSLISLSVLMLFDIFTYVFHTINVVESVFRSKLLFAGWLIQYSFRFIVINVTSHITTKQAVNAKTLITDINNRYLDSSTKEELQLFYTQISSRSIEFTACDLFTLNTRLITSAIAAGATYLVILVQFHSGRN